jgi:hypothetical protein
MRISLLFSLLMTFSLLSSFGCGGNESTQSSGQGGPTAEAALKDLVELLKSAEVEKKKVPTRLEELQPFEGIYLGACMGIQQKQITYIWGSKLSGGSAIIAHDSNAEKDGGFVLLQDGTVKKMTADEFKAAEKAKKK